MKPSIKQHLQKGITIIEFMVAFAISLILMAGIMQVLISNKQSYRIQEAFARVQENGRYAMQFVSRDLRMAGFMGCAGLSASPNNIVDLDSDGNPDEIANFSGHGLQGMEYGDLPLTLSDTLSLTAANVIANTDIVRIKHASRTGIRLADPVPTVSAQLKLDAATASGMFQVNDILFVTDCEEADLFTVTGINAIGANYVELAHAATKNISPSLLSKAYGRDAEVMKLKFTTFYIANNSAGVPSLYKYTLGNADTMNSQELVEGIEDLQALYGLDTDGDKVVNRFVNATAVTDFSQVISIRITVRARSIEDRIASKITVYGDHRLRRTFTTLITIRNRAA